MEILELPLPSPLLTETSLAGSLNLSPDHPPMCSLPAARLRLPWTLVSGPWAPPTVVITAGYQTDGALSLSILRLSDSYLYFLRQLAGVEVRTRGRIEIWPPFKQTV